MPSLPFKPSPIVTRHLAPLIGRTITHAWQLSPSECDEIGLPFTLSCPAVMLVLDNGASIVPMCDPECNGPGHLEICPPPTEPHP